MKIIFRPEITRIIKVGQQGPSGSVPVWEEFENHTHKTIHIPCVAGENIGGHKWFYVEDGKAYKATSSNADKADQISGLTLGAVTESEEFEGVTFGYVTDPTFAFTPNSRIFVGENGEISQTITGSFIKTMGIAISDKVLLINIGITVYNQ